MPINLFTSYSTEEHPCIVLDTQQGAVRRLGNLRSDWNDLRMVGLARIVGKDALGNAGAFSEQLSAISTPTQRFYFGFKSFGDNLPETSNTKFIGVGPGSSIARCDRNYDAGALRTHGATTATQNMARFGVSTHRNTGDRAWANVVGVSFGTTRVNGVYENFGVTNSSRHNRFQPAFPDSNAIGEETSNIASVVGLRVTVSDRGTEDQAITVFCMPGIRNATIMTSLSSFTYATTAPDRFHNFAEGVLDTFLGNLSSEWIDDPNSGNQNAITVAAPHSVYPLNGINSFFIYWPFNNSRLVLFNLKVQDFTV